MIRSLILFMILVPATQLLAQGSVFSSWESRFLPDVDIEHYPDFEFDWNIPGKVQADLNAGLTELVDEKNYEKALLSFDRAIAALPTFAASHYFRGVCHKNLRKISLAEKDFKTVVEILPESAEGYVELGEVFQLQYNLFEAAKCYRQAIKLNPKLVEGYFNLANIRRLENNRAGAMKFYEKCNEVDPHFADAYLRQAFMVYTGERKLNQALALIDSSIKADSTFKPAYFWKGLIYANNNSYDEALKNWNKLIQYDPADEMLIVMRAFLHMENNDFDKAFADLKKVLSNQYVDENQFRAKQSSLDRKLDLQFALTYFTRTAYGLPDESLSPMKRGMCLLFSNDRSQEAIDSFRKANSFQPSSPGYFLMAVAFEHSNKHDSAFYYYEKAIALDRDIFDAHKKLGIYRAELKDWKGAFKNLTELERIEPSLMITYRLRGEIRIQFKDYYGGIIDFTRFIRSDTTDGEVYFMRAVCFKSVGDFTNANADFKIAFDLDTRRFEAADQYISTFLELHDTIQAIKAIDYCQDVLKDEYFAEDMRVDILIKAGRYNEAREIIQKLTQKNVYAFTQKQLSIFYFFDGLIDFRTGDYASANSRLDKAIKADDNNIEALYYKGKTLIALGNTKKAIGFFERAAKANYLDSESVLRSLLAADTR